jgi:hypothetical protein
VFAVLSGVAALVATSLFVRNFSEPPPGSDGFVHGLAAAGAILFGLQGLLVVAVGVTLAGLEAVDVTTTRQRLVGQVGTGVAAIGPPLVLVGVHIGGPAELIGTAFVSVILGTLLVMGLCTWVFVARVVRGIRASVG